MEREWGEGGFLIKNVVIVNFAMTVDDVTVEATAVRPFRMMTSMITQTQQ